MKKIISLILAFAMLAMTGTAFAEETAPAGILTAEINVKREPIVHMGVLGASDLSYSVSVASSSSKTEGVIIKSSCGEKVYPEETIILAPGTAISKDYVMNDLLRGVQKIKIEVVTNTGKKLTDYTMEEKIIPPNPENQFLAPYTRKLGMRIGNFNESMSYNQIVKFDALRAESGWGAFESQKGVVDVSNSVNQRLDDYKKEQYDITFTIPYNNPIYMEEGQGTRTFLTKENYDAYAHVVGELVKEQKDYLDYYEMLNEPNSTDADTTGYAYLSELTWFDAHESKPDIKVGIGSVANGDASFVERALEAGVWPHCDAVTNHPYIRPALVDEAYFDLVSMMTQVITRFGGWKDQTITELGWPNHTAGISKEQSAIEFAKSVIVSDYFDIPFNSLYTTGDNHAYDPDNSEDNFGVIWGYWNVLKPAAYTLRAVTDETRGAVFAGKIPFKNKDIEAYLYLRDGTVTCAIWSKGAETTVDIPCSSAVDIYGNPVSVSGGVKLGETITYLRGVSRDWLISSLEQNIEDYIYTYTDYRNAFQDSATNKGFDKALATVRKTKEYARELASLGEYPSEEKAFEYMEKHYALNKELIDLRESGEIELTDAQLCGMLYLNQWAGMLYNAIYIMAVEDNTLTNYTPVGRDAMDKTRAYMDEKKGNGTLSYAEAIMVYANDYTSDAESIMKTPGNDPMKARTAKAWDNMGRLLAETAMYMAEVEPVRYDNVLVQLLKPQRYVKLMQPDTKEVSVYNFREDVLKGTVQAIAPNGDVVAESEVLTLNPGETVAAPVTFNLNTMMDGMYKIAFVENGEKIVERDANLVIEPSFFIEMQASEDVFDNVNNVSFNVTYRDEDTFSGKVTVEPLCNWKLEGAVNSPVSLKSGVVQELSFAVSEKEAVPYHFYPFKIRVFDENGTEVYTKTELLSFTVIKKTDKELSTSEFNGDITDWADAYPTFARYPADPEHRSGYPIDPTDKNNWFDKQLYGRMMTKWDDNFLYVLFDVYDWYHENLQDSANIWNGDSIQLSFDTLNDGTSDTNLYDDNDFEFGFAFNEKKGNVVYTWKDSVGGKEQEKPSDWVNIIRNQADGITRYMAKIPKEALVPLKFTEGYTFGMDALFNNSNTGTRVDVLSFADGISHGKQPWKFWDFTFVTDELTFDNPGTPIIPVTMEPSDGSVTETDTVSFKDIKGHWAESIISEFSKTGYVKGMSATEFAPDDMVTRAQFVQMLINISKDASGAETVYGDVDSSKWYYGAITAAEKAGYLPSELGENTFAPEKPITREEAAAIIDRWYVPGGGIGQSVNIDSFADSDSISPWAVEAFENLCTNSVFEGDESGRLNPKMNITRAEAVAIFSRSLN